MKRTLRTVLALACIFVIMFCAVLIAQKVVGRARMDLTEYKLYTLSDGTRNILGGLNQPVRLKLYYARVAAMKGPEGIRYYNNYYLYVRDLLEEYVGLSNGMLSLAVIDPRRFSDEEEEALAHGLKRFPLSEDENFFFGLVAQTELGKEKAIPIFEPQRQEFVEYDVSKLIVSVTRRDKKKVGVLSSLPVMGSDMSPYMMQMLQAQGRAPEGPWTLISHLRDEYDVVSVKPDVEAIGEDVDFLMVVHPKDLAKKTLFAIDQYVMRGGKLLVFQDPHCLSDRPAQDPSNPYAAMSHKAASDLNALLRNWGVEMDAGLVAADRMLAIRAALQRDASPEPIVTCLSLNEECFNREEVVTAELHSVRVLFAGALTPVAEAGTTVTPLLTTTAAGNTWQPKSPFELMMPNPEAMMRAVRDGREPLTLACRITGNLKTNFPDGVPSDEAAEEKSDEETSKADDEAEPVKPESPPPKPIQEASPDAAVLVFADVDLISDMVAYQDSFFGTTPVGDNASLVFNALDFLGGSGDLIAIRSRGRFNRPFDVVDRIEAAAEEATASEVEAVNNRIAGYREELRKLESAATEENVKLIESAAVAERRKLEEDIRTAQKDLRRLNAAKREKIEALKASLQTHHMVWAPATVLLIAVVLAVMRHIRARRYASRRA